MADSRHLEKNLKIVISKHRFDRSPQNLAQWRSSTLLTVPIVQNLKSKMAATAILNISVMF